MIHDAAEVLIYRADVTGIVSTLFILPTGIKIAVDPPDSLDPRAATVAMSLDGGVSGKLDARLARQVQHFVALNRAALRDYWRYEIDGDGLRRRLVAAVKTRKNFV